MPNEENNQSKGQCGRDFENKQNWLKSTKNTLTTIESPEVEGEIMVELTSTSLELGRKWC